MAIDPRSHSANPPPAPNRAAGPPCPRTNERSVTSPPLFGLLSLYRHDTRVWNFSKYIGLIHGFDTGWRQAEPAHCVQAHRVLDIGRPLRQIVVIRAIYVELAFQKNGTIPVIDLLGTKPEKSRGGK